MKPILNGIIILLLAIQYSIANPLPPNSLGMYIAGVKQVGRTIAFSGAMSNDNGDVLNGGFTPKWKWDFDYKSSTFTDDAITTSYLVSHIYDLPGTYSVAVIYYDDDNQQGNTFTFSISIEDGGVSTFEMQPIVNSQINYFLSRELHTEFTSSDPNMTNQITYTDPNGFADVTSLSGWTYGSGVKFDTLISAEPVIRMGAPQWTELRRSAGTGNIVARVDFYPDDSTAGTPHVLGFDGSSNRFCVIYNYSIDRFQIQKSDFTALDTFALNAPPNYWYTVEVEKGTDGKCVAWVYPRGESRNYCDTKHLSGYPESWTCTAFSASNDDYFYLTNYYVGSYSQNNVYRDGIGRTLQSQVRDGVNDIVTAVSYDNVGRQIKTYRPILVSTTHSYYTNITSSYNEITYYSDPYSRVQFNKPAGWSSSDEWIENRYGAESIGELSYNYTDVSSKVGAGTPKMSKRMYADKLGRVIKTTMLDYDTSVEEISDSTIYSMLGLPIKHFDPLKLQTTNTYDFLGRMTNQTSPDGGNSQFMYDKANRLRYMLDAEGIRQNPDNTLYWKYDAIGRVIEKGYISLDGSNFPTQTDNQSFPSTPATWRKKYTYDGNGSMLFTKNRLVKVESNNDNDNNPEVIETFDYDKDGNVLAVSVITTDFSLDKYSTQYSYDHLGRVLSVQYPTLPTDAVLQADTVRAPNLFTSQSISTIIAGPSFVVASGATATLKALQSIKLVPGFRASGGSIFKAKIDAAIVNNVATVKQTYNQLGQIAAIGNGNYPDSYASYTYNAEGKITQERLNDGATSKKYYYSSTRGYLDSTVHDNFREAFSYSGYYNGSIASVAYTHSGSGATPNYNYAFAYDKYNRMISGNNSNNTVNDIIVSLYDENGKVKTRTYGTTSQTFNYYSGKNRLQNVNGGGSKLLYDSTGNMIGNVYKGMTLAYDPFTMMADSITLGTTVEKFQYDGKKERVLKTSSVIGSKTTTLYLRGIADYPIVEKTGTSSTATDKYYVYGPTGIIAVQEGTSTYFVVKDHLGSTRIVLNSGNIPVSWYDYTPYGTIWQSYQNKELTYKFTGQERDNEIGLNNFRARMYDDSLNIFYAVDPSWQKYPMQSPYNYVLSNPIVMIDPTGRDTLMFNSDGSYTGKYIEDETNKYYARILDKKGKAIETISFHDSKDAKSIMSTRNSDGSLRPPEKWEGNGDGFKITGLNFEYQKSIDKSVQTNLSNVDQSYVQGADGFNVMMLLNYVVSESQGYGKMDYLYQRAEDLKSSDLAVIGDRAFNSPDAGNYMWGKTMGVLGFTEPISKIGAQIFSVFRDHKFDQTLDQKAIEYGIRSNGR